MLIRKNKKGKRSQGSYKLIMRLEVSTKMTPQTMEIGLETSDLKEALKRAKWLVRAAYTLCMYKRPVAKLKTAKVDGNEICYSFDIDTLEPIKDLEQGRLAMDSILDFTDQK